MTHTKNCLFWIENNAILLIIISKLSNAHKQMQVTCFNEREIKRFHCIYTLCINMYLVYL